VTGALLLEPLPVVKIRDGLSRETHGNGGEHMKIGRNDPCPCGSGKKYKKCCGADPGDSVDFSLPEECRTGTLLDEYQMLLPAVSLYYEKIVQFDSEGKQLEKAAADFERAYSPGTPEGVPDSMFLSWLHFDLRFGRSGMTLCERFLESSTIRKLLEPGPTLLRHMADSYSAFHHVFKVEKDGCCSASWGPERNGGSVA
jgi:SEC-C motif